MSARVKRDRLMKLAGTFQVSQSAMRFRLRELGIEVERNC